MDSVNACVALAEKYHAFGILSDNTDFLIHQCSAKIHIFSTRNLNFRTLHTVEYLRPVLADKLGIDAKFLPVFATLKGNDVIPAMDLTHFHRGLYSRDRLYVIYRVCHFINQNQADIGNMAWLSKKVFGHEGNADLLQTSIDSYSNNATEDFNEEAEDINEEDDHFPEEWKRLIKLLGYEGKILNIMMEGTWEDGVHLEDHRNLHLPFAVTLQRDIRRRIYGILLLEKPGALNNDRSQFNYQVEEWCYTGPRSLNRARYSRPMVPPKDIEHPGLAALWENQEERILGEGSSNSLVHDLRWKLFAYTINPDLDAKIVQGLCEKDLFMVCQLYIMQHNWLTPVLTKHEVQTFILMHLRLKTMTYEEIDQMSLDVVPSARSIQLTTLYTTSILPHVSQVVGDVIARKYWMSISNFEGYLFQNLYKDYVLGEGAEVLPGQEPELTNLFNIVTSNGKRVSVV